MAEVGSRPSLNAGPGVGQVPRRDWLNDEEGTWQQPSASRSAPCPQRRGRQTARPTWECRGDRPSTWGVGPPLPGAWTGLSPKCGCVRGGAGLTEMALVDEGTPGRALQDDQELAKQPRLRGRLSRTERRATCGQEVGLAPENSTFCQDLDLHLNLFGRPQGDSWLYFLSPQTPQRLLAQAPCKGLGAWDPTLTLSSPPHSEALETPPCHLPLAPGEIPGLSRCGGPSSCPEAPRASLPPTCHPLWEPQRKDPEFDD